MEHKQYTESTVHSAWNSVALQETSLRSNKGLYRRRPNG